jgi:C4-dicarboxylate-specific signal transduction histidine kinase
LSKNLSLKRKILTAAGLSFSIAGIIIAIAVFLLSFNYFQKSSIANLEIFAKDQAIKVAASFDGAEKVVEQASKYQPLIDYVGGQKNPQDSQTVNYLKSYNIGGDFLNLYILDDQGKTIASVDPVFLGKNYSFRDYFKEAIQGNSFLDSDVGVTTGQLGYYISRPIIKDGKVVGVLVGKLKPSVIEKTLKSGNEYLNNSLIFTDSYGVVLYSEKSGRYLKSLGPLSSENSAEVKALNRYGAKKIEPLTYNKVQQKVEEKMSGIVTLDFFDKADNEDEIVSLTKVNGKPYYLVLEVEKESIIITALTIAISVGAITLIMIALAMIVMAMVVTRVLKPLDLFAKASEDIAVGNFKKIEDLNTGDEFEDLGKAFNKMSSGLKEASEEMEKKVQKRTSDLEQVNTAMVGRELKMIELKKEISDLKVKEDKKR